MKKQFVIWIMLTFFLAGCSDLNYSPPLKAVDGTFVMSENDLSKDAVIPLSGEWMFFSNELLSATQVEERFKSNRDVRTVTLPSNWDGELGDSRGYGTYAIRLNLPETKIGNSMAFYLRYQSSAYTLFVDGQRIASNGYVGTSKETTIPKMVPQIGYFVPKNTSVWVVLHVSNFMKNHGGADQDIFFGHANAISNYNANRTAAVLFINGGIIMMGLYQIAVYFFRRVEKPFLHFGLLSLCISLRSFFVGAMFFPTIFPNIPWLWQYRLEYLFMYSAGIFFTQFIRKLYPKQMSIYAVWIFIAIVIPLMLITLVTEPIFFVRLFHTLAPFVLMYLLYVIFVLVRAIVNKRPTATLNLVASILFFIAVINDLLVAMDFIRSYQVMTYGFFIYVVIQSFNLSRNYARKFHESEQLSEQLLQLNASLDDKIHQRTLELQETNKRLEKLTTIDGLTGISNRRYFDEQLQRLFKEHGETNEVLSLLMIDIDNFKKYNDTYGHQMGDDLLKRVTYVIAEVVGEKGIFARYGGEEFAIILPKTERELALQVAENIRFAVEHLKIVHKGRNDFPYVTISVGGSSTRGYAFEDEYQLIEMADKKLYDSKRLGRNRVTFA